MSFYAYNIATLEDGSDVLVEQSMGSPGSDIASDEIETRPLGPRMTDALGYIASHPGAAKVDVYRALGTHPHPWGGYVDRLLDRGLVYNIGRSNRAALYVPQALEPEPGYWRPGHP